MVKNNLFKNYELLEEEIEEEEEEEIEEEDETDSTDYKALYEKEKQEKEQALADKVKTESKAQKIWMKLDNLKKQKPVEISDDLLDRKLYEREQLKELWSKYPDIDIAEVTRYATENEIDKLIAFKMFAFDNINKPKQEDINLTWKPNPNKKSNKVTNEDLQKMDLIQFEKTMEDINSKKVEWIK